MIPFRSSAVLQATNASPSITMERGTYRMRAPSSHTTLQSLRLPSKSIRQNHRSDYRIFSNLAVLVAVLALASVSSFVIAYYLFSSRWDPRQIGQLSSTNGSQVVSVDVGQDTSAYGGEERFLSYLPHSGFHNQRIAFENALVLSRITNRTLLVPPVYLGTKPIHYVPFNALSQELVLANKVGLQHCSRITSLTPLPLECTDYFDHTQIPWNWLVDINLIKRKQRLGQRWNFSETWISESLNISKADILFIKDDSPYQYRFLDTRWDSLPSNHKYSESIFISDLIAAPERFIQIGTLFGSSRLRLRNATYAAIRSDIRETMSFTNPSLLHAANSIANSLGSSYIGVHLRLGDGDFKSNEKVHVREAWWKVVCGILGFNEHQALVLEQEFSERRPEVAPKDYEDNILLDRPMDCRSPLHTNQHHLQLNTPIFISTDVDKNNPVLSGFWRTFPCIFFLSDFPDDTAVLDLRNPLDGVSLKPILAPFLDALIVGHAWKVVGTSNSTFSTFIEDVIWRKHHALSIAQRG